MPNLYLFTAIVVVTLVGGCATLPPDTPTPTSSPAPPVASEAPPSSPTSKPVGILQPISLTVRTSYNSSYRASGGIEDSDGTRATNLESNWPARGMPVIVSVLEGPETGDANWTGDAACERRPLPRNHHGPQYVWDCSNLTVRQSYLLPRPLPGVASVGAARQVQYFLDENGSIRFTSPVPVRIALGLQGPYTQELRSAMASPQGCENPVGSAHAWQLEGRPGRVHLPHEAVLIDGDAAGTLFWFGYCLEDQGVQP